MSSRSPRKRRKAVIFNEDVTARLRALGYNTKPRSFGEAPRPLGEDLSSEGEEEGTESGSSEGEGADASPSKAGGSEGMTIHEMMRKAEEGAARLDGRAFEAVEQSVASDDSMTGSTSSPPPKQTRRKKERPRFSFAELNGLVAKHKEAAVASRAAQLAKRERSARRLSTRNVAPEATTVKVATSDADYASSEVDELASPRSISPLETPSAMLSKMALDSAQKQVFASSSAFKLFDTLNQPATSPLPPTSPFYRDSPSPPKSRKKSYISSHPLIFEDVRFPSFFTGRASGARILRRRLAWLLETARDLARQPEQCDWKDEKWLGRELARLAGLSDEWWRVNSTFFRDEQELQLSSLASFRPFEASTGDEDPPIALYHSFVLHWKLCGHDDAECRFYQALVLFHSHRLAPKTSGKVRVPLSLDFDDKKVQSDWIDFAEFWLDLAEEKGWDVSTVGKRVRSRSPRKRPRSTVDAKDAGLGQLGVKKEALGDRIEGR